MHVGWTGSYAGSRTVAARLEAIGNGRICNRAERQTFDQQHGSDRHPRPIRRVQQSVDDRRHRAKPRGHAEAGEANGTAQRRRQAIDASGMRALIGEGGIERSASARIAPPDAAYVTAQEVFVDGGGLPPPQFNSRRR